VRLLSIENLGHAGGIGRVAAQETVAPQDPEITGPRDRRDGRVRNLVFVRLPAFAVPSETIEQTIKVVFAKAHLARLRLQRMKGELVDRARATALVFRLAREERDTWSNWPARVAALMAAELGVAAHPMQKALETHVRAHLAELAGVVPDLR
jgi:hypothetical protein